MNRTAHVAESAAGLVGQTPVVQLSRVWGGPGRILAKAEFLQPAGSVKDRAARAIIEAARADGRLKPSAPVVEMTSGNMGAGLAVVCAALGHPLVVTMSAGNSPQRARMLEALGAEVILVPQIAGEPGQVTGPDIAAAARIAEHLAAARGGFYVDQFNAPEGKAAHEAGTGRERLDAVCGSIDGWTACVGTGCTFLGSRGLCEWQIRASCAAPSNRPDLRCLLAKQSKRPSICCRGRAMAASRRCGSLA